MLEVKRQSQVTFLQSELLNRVPGIVHAFSTRRGERNDFTLSAESINPLIQMNRVRFLAAIGAAGWPIIKLKQVHSATVCAIQDTLAASEAVECDGAITDLHGVIIGIQNADCVPILLADRQGRAVAAVHAGWRGTAARILEIAVARLNMDYSIAPRELVACIGPHIGVCCYEVGEDVVSALNEPIAFQRRADWQKPHLDLGEANRRQLAQAGVNDDHIEVSSLCTKCRQDLFYSFRGEGKRAGRMLSVIGISP